MAGTAIEKRRRAFLFAFSFYHVDKQMIERHRIGSQDNLLREEQKFRALQKRATLPQAAQAIRGVSLCRAPASGKA